MGWRGRAGARGRPRLAARPQAGGCRALTRAGSWPGSRSAGDGRHLYLVGLGTPPLPERTVRDLDGPAGAVGVAGDVATREAPGCGGPRAPSPQDRKSVV